MILCALVVANAVRSIGCSRGVKAGIAMSRACGGPPGNMDINLTAPAKRRT